MIALLSDHELSDDDQGINLSYIAELTGDDWGLWRTITRSAERLDRVSGEIDGFTEVSNVHRQISTLLTALEDSPKTRKWRMRAKVGERRRWYAVPEEEH